MVDIYDYFKIGISLVVAIVISFTVTPSVMRFAKKIDAIDVPADDRRMHKRPIPLVGGLSIIIGFTITSLFMLYSDHHGSLLLLQILPGAIIIGILGVIDDKRNLPALPRLFVQCIAAGAAVLAGVHIQGISAIKILGLPNFNLGFLTIPITIFWIVGITNAVNIIDGLDGLAAGVSTISSLSMLTIAILMLSSNPEILLSVAVLTAALSGGCIGLLPYNTNPAKIFMGSTGATFLGFVLSIISIQGLFKFYTAISFAVPFLILGLPILDTTLSIIRRLSKGKSPFSPDRGHLHHKLIDMGLSQKQAVAALYSVSAVLGIIAVVSSIAGSSASWVLFFIGVVVIFFIYLFITEFSKRNNHNDNDNENEKPQIKDEELISSDHSDSIDTPTESKNK
jgi:UDP-GlcNAc:undecaprenyl-phosphate GlcNAc-1-phosphate transferase